MTSDDPADRLVRLGEMRDRVEAMTLDAVESARAAGLSWRTIADRLGLPLSTVHDRYRRVDRGAA